MNCDRSLELLSAYIDEMLSPEELRAMNAHLDTCSRCATELAQLRETIRLVQSLDTVPLPAYFHAELRGRLREAERNRSGAGAVVHISRRLNPLPYVKRVSARMAYSAAAAAAVLAIGVSTYLNFQALQVAQNPIIHSDELLGGAPIGQTSGDRGDSGHGVPPDRNSVTPAGQIIDVTQLANYVQMRAVTGTMELHVTSVPDAVGQVRQLVEIHNGYIQNESSETVESKPVARLKLRVPVEKYNTVFQALKSLGYVAQHSTDADDVTMQVIDYEAHIKSLKISEESLLEMKRRARTVDDLLNVEQRLTQIRADIESMQASLDYLKNSAAMATINVLMFERTALTTSEGPSFAQQLLAAFLKTIDGITFMAGRLAVGTAGALPILGLGAIGFAGLRAWRRQTKRRHGGPTGE